MVQTMIMAIALLIAGAIIQMNLSMIHTQTPLTLPGEWHVPMTYFRLLAAIGGAAVLVWLAGMLDLALLRARLRRRDAAMVALEQDLLRFKASAYDQQQPALGDVRSRLEVVVHELRGMLTRVENVLRGIPEGGSPEEATVIRSERSGRPQATVVTGPPAPAVDESRDLQEAGAAPRKRWPF